jgi:hypothetical protein
MSAGWVPNACLTPYLRLFALVARATKIRNIIRM